MQEFHTDKERYFQMQYLTARFHVIPFIEQGFGPVEGRRVLEIGCAEAGVLKAFLERHCTCVGIELSPSRIEKAMEFHSHAVREGKITFLNRNVYDIDPQTDLKGGFDIIVLKDVIEHIPGQEKIVNRLKDFLQPGGVIFFGFPPWQMPFGGHQQIAKSKAMSHWPYIHLLPRGLYQGLLTLFGEEKATIRELLEIKATGITIERFEKIVVQAGMKIAEQKHFLINPIYEYKFNLKPREQFKLVKSIPLLRNFLTSAVYYLISSNDQD